MTDISHIRGTDGTLTVDRTTGAIIDRDHDDSQSGYPEIKHFEPSTLTDSRLDILECGYHTENGYVEPEPDFVAHVAHFQATGVGLL